MMAEPGFKAYQKYVAVKSHFKQKNFDYFKYAGKTRVSENNFLQRRDRYYFAKLERKHKKDLLYFLVSNIIEDNDIWIGDLLSEQAEKRFMNWKRRVESLKYNFKKDMGVIRDYMDKHDISFDDVFRVSNSDHPVIFKLLMTDDISLESFVILDQCIKFISRLNKKLVDDPIWSMYNEKIIKYSRFVNINTSEYRDILKSIFIS
jgi:hypothetical protein